MVTLRFACLMRNNTTHFQLEPVSAWLGRVDGAGWKFIRIAQFKDTVWKIGLFVQSTFTLTCS